nr:hypothetical protein HK105_005165 [Polyrhizophydium stewartii]
MTEAAKHAESTGSRRRLLVLATAVLVIVVPAVLFVGLLPRDEGAGPRQLRLINELALRRQEALAESLRGQVAELQAAVAAAERKAEAATQRAANYDTLALLVVNAPPGYPLWGPQSVENKYQYARRHGYGFLLENGLLNTSRPAAWTKVKALQTHMRMGHHKWLWSIDMDAVITNFSIEAHKLLDDRFDVIVSPDCNVLNTGSIFFKASEWSLQFLQRIWEREFDEPRAWWENAAFVNLHNEDEEVRRHVKVVEQRAINAYPPIICNRESSNWQPGDFVIHYPSLSHSEGFPEMIKQKIKEAAELNGL